MSRRLVYGTLGALVALVLALGIGAQQLVQRENGARLLASALTRFYPQLTVEHRAGPLQRAEFTRILWEDAEVRVELRGIRWRLDPGCLGWGKLCFEHLAIDSLEVQLSGGDTDDSPFALAPVRAPLPLDIRDGRLAVLRVLEGGEEQVRIEAIALAGDWRGSRVGIERAEARLGRLRAEASGTIALRGQLPLSAAGRVQWAERAPLMVSAKGDLGELAFNVRGAETLPFEASGTVDALATPVALAFTARQLQPMRIGLPRGGPLQFAAVTLQGSGDLRHLALELEGDIESALLGANHLRASGSWGEAETLVEHATLRGALGELDGAFRLERASGAWQASAALREACIPGWRAAFDCHINGNVEARGRLADGPERADARLALAGRVNGIPATLEGRARLDAAGLLRIEGLRLGSGANTLRLDGSTGERLAIDGVLELDRLADTWPDATGRGHGTLRIEGTLDAPALRATLDLEGLESAGVHVGSARLRADWQGAASAANALAITLERGRFRDQTFARAELRLEGSRAAHALQAVVSGDALALALACKGSGQDTGDWQGQCATLDAGAGAPESTWRLEQPLTLQRREATLSIAPFCLRREASALCSEQRMRIARGGQIDGIRVRAGALPVAMIQNWLPEDLRAEGTMDLLLEVTRPAGGPFRVQARLDAPAVSLHTLAAGEDLTLTLRELVATLASADDTTRLDWRAAVGDVGSTRGSLTLEGATADATIAGRIELARIDVGPLLREAPGVLDARGTLDGEVTLEGRAEAPRALGRLRLHEAALVHERLPQPLQAVDLALDFAGPRATIAGHVGTGAGEIVIGGEATWNDTGWQADLDLHAEGLALEPLRGSTLTVAPDLRVALRPQSASITGTLAIPSADLNLDAVPESAVRVSDDAVTVGAPPGEARFDYTLALDVRLGEAVRFRGLGADVRLGGQLQLERLAGSALQGTGELSVREGRYRAYGQRLEITEGQLLFRGPLDDPALRITAVRRIEDEPVTVGVRVRGDLRAPELRVFSRPAMAESRALHYLLTGRAPSLDDDSDMAGADAMLQLGLAGANRVTGSVMSKFGIEDFEMSSRQLEDGQEVHLSGYLTPNLYLRYGVSTFDKVYTFRLRYRLRPQFFVEAISGIENAIDFLYSFER